MYAFYFLFPVSDSEIWQEKSHEWATYNTMECFMLYFQTANSLTDQHCGSSCGWEETCDTTAKPFQHREIVE